MLIDDIDISIKAGSGGKGNVHFYRDRWRPKGGPDGGDGGDGGSIYFQAESDISLFSQFRFQKKFEAQPGEPGGKNQSTGHNGRDLIVKVPVGTIASYDNGTQIEFTKVGQKEIMAKGGRGGRGNYSYRSSTNQTPQEFEPGFKTTPKRLHLQLKLIANVGLIGLPNAGKSSLLNEISNANAKVANYEFTTLEPNLGVTKAGHIIADIPGLIEGASEGKGLGYKFLKHIERTQLLLHCIAADSHDPQKDYQVVRKELESYSSKLLNKPEIVILTKSDLLDEKELKKLKTSIKPKLAVSILDDNSIKKLSDLISQSMDKLNSPDTK